MPLKFLDANNVGSVAHAVEAINYATLLRTRTTNPRQRAGDQRQLGRREVRSRG